MCNLIIHYCLGSSHPWDTYLHQNLYESIQVLVIKHEYYIKYRIQCTTFHMKVLSVDDDTGTNWSLQMRSIKISVCSCICHIWKLVLFLYSDTYTFAYNMTSAELEIGHSFFCCTAHPWIYCMHFYIQCNCVHCIYVRNICISTYNVSTCIIHLYKKHAFSKLNV